MKMNGNISNKTLSHKLKIPFEPYKGKEHYIFISYKHKDNNLIYPIIKKLHDNGFNIWYDAGLPYGKNYDIQIANKIKNSSLFVNFITKTTMDCANDEEDYMIKEFSIARNFKKNILPIYLDDIPLDGFYLVHLLGKQSIFKHEYGNNEDLFIQACTDAFINDFNLTQNYVQSKNLQEDFEFEKSLHLGEKIKKEDPRLTSKFLKEFEKLNTTTESIFDLGENNVLIILKDGTNLTDWNEVTNKKNIIYISENLSDSLNLNEKYKDLKSLKALVASGVSENVTEMDSMFEGCNNLVDLSALKEWNVSNVTSMRSMFNRCNNLVDLSALKDWDVSNVESMEEMFEGCIKLKDLSALKDWNISNLKDMVGMFGDCALEELSALKDWDVSNVTTMARMFRGCSSLLDLFALKDWNLSKVTNLNSMFEGCFSLVNLFALKDWDVSNVTNLDSIFRACEGLVDLFALQNWNVSNVTTMESMFRGCSDLDNLFVLKDWDVSNVKNMRGMFSTCRSLVEVAALKDWDVSNVENMRSMFYGCFNLVDLSALKDWDVSNVKNMWTMFTYCGALEDLSFLRDWDVSNVETMWAMFTYCSALVDLSVLDDWDVSDLTNISSIFEGCNSVEKYPKWYNDNKL